MSKVESAKSAVHNMLIYYYQALKEKNCNDPKQVIATEVGKMINLTDEQVVYMLKHCTKDFDIIEILSNMQVLLVENKTKKVYMEDNIKLLNKSVNKLLELFSGIK